MEGGEWVGMWACRGGGRQFTTRVNKRSMLSVFNSTHSLAYIYIDCQIRNAAKDVRRMRIDI